MKGLLALFLLLLPALVFAQQQTTVNGSEHPELIPDAMAVSAVFSMHSMPTAAAHRAKIGLSASDLAIYAAAMLSYRSSGNHTTATYNNLMQSLSADGQNKLKTFIQAEKAHMQYHTQPPIPQ